MSVTDPLIKDIKGCTLTFLNELQCGSNYVEDSSSTLLNFCQIIEKVFYANIKVTANTLGFIKCITPWMWMEEIVEENHSLATFPYKNSIDFVKENKNLVANVGKFRLLIRCLLVNKCLHIPIEYLLSTRKYAFLYRDTSVLGDEILLQILLSVILKYSNLVFKLDLKNTSFLDLSWRIPEIVKLELVPSESLGLSVSFAGEKAVIVGILSNSVISETGKAEIGDILDNLNGVHISHASKGKLQSILSLSKGKPINCAIIKAVYTSTKEVYLPIVRLLKQVNIDPDILKNRIHATNSNCITNISTTKKSSSGFKVKYIGSFETGNRGDVKVIDKAARSILGTFNTKTKSTPSNKVPKIQDVFFEVGEMGVKIVDKINCEIMFKHSYMEISSCGSIQFLNNYFAYVAGDEYCNKASKFTCYLFSSEDSDANFTILQSIGQGFHRTHFAV